MNKETKGINTTNITGNISIVECDDKYNQLREEIIRNVPEIRFETKKDLSIITGDYVDTDEPRDITLEDCLIAIEKSVINKDEYIMTVYNEFQKINTDTGEYIETVFVWQPNKPLQDQEQETIDLLRDLICKDG